MIWQDFVFLVGSMTSVLFLYPTLRDTAARVPRETSIPSMLIGGAYSFTFLTLGMTFSAVGSFAACTMWSLIAAFRAPDSASLLERSYVSSNNRWIAKAEAVYRDFADDVSGEPTAVEAEFEHSSAGEFDVDDGFDAEFDIPSSSD